MRYFSGLLAQLSPASNQLNFPTGFKSIRGPNPNSINAGNLKILQNQHKIGSERKSWLGFGIMFNICFGYRFTYFHANNYEWELSLSPEGFQLPWPRPPPPFVHAKTWNAYAYRFHLLYISWFRARGGENYHEQVERKTLFWPALGEKLTIKCVEVFPGLSLPRPPFFFSLKAEMYFAII